MKHASIGRWSDYVRGIVDPAEREELDAHLVAGCARCQRTVEVLGGVAEVGRGEARWEPPPEVVRAARAIYSHYAPERLLQLPRRIAQLVYDSCREPLPAGVRAQGRLSRQVLFRAGDYFLDLRLEAESSTGQVSLVGQIADRAHPDSPMAHAPVVLARGEEVVARTMSNEFGEFSMAYTAHPHVRLCVPTGRDELIEVELSRVPEEGEVAASRTEVETV